MLSRVARSAPRVNALQSRGYKLLSFGGEGRQKLLAGVNMLADAVAVTLGPRGRMVLIQQAFGPPKVRTLVLI